MKIAEVIGEERKHKFRFAIDLEVADLENLFAALKNNGSDSEEFKVEARKIIDFAKQRKITAKEEGREVVLLQIEDKIQNVFFNEVDYMVEHLPYRL